MAGPKFTNVLVAWVAASGALAAPAPSPSNPTAMMAVDASNIGEVSNAGGAICSGLMKKAVCCEGALLGLVHTGCIAPFPIPTSAIEFVRQCNNEAKTAQCCSLNLVRYLCFPLLFPIHAARAIWR